MNGFALQKKGRIDEFDGLRGLLALWVVISHILCWCGFANLPPSIPGKLRHLWEQFSYAPAAVDTFIILSGFVISYLLHFAKSNNYGHFMVGRFFRLYPVYLLSLLLGLVAIYQSPFIFQTAIWHDNEYFKLCLMPVSNSQLTHTAAHLSAHLTLLFGMIPEKILPWTPFALLAPAWSISLEWQYYLVAPLLAVLIYKRLGLLLLGLIGCGGFVYAHFWTPAFLPASLSLFLVGIGSFHLYLWVDRQKEIPNLNYAFIIILLAVITAGWHWIALCIWTLVFGCACAVDHNSNNDGIWRTVRKFLLFAPFQNLGKISYPMYLIHWPVIIFFLACLLHLGPQLSSSIALCALLFLGLPIVFTAAWLLHRFIEIPLMRWGRKFVMP